jgi:AraC-like DNA-binding protein
MRHLATIAEYCQHINVPPPRWPHFDIRSFAENMKTVNMSQPPFRHEFYAIALRLCGTNRHISGKPLAANLFFNTPYQIISWEIDPDWRGWYIIFDEEFVRSNPQWANFLLDFPFMRLDRSIPFDLPPDEETFLDSVFQKIAAEYHGGQPDAFAFIRAYTHLLLLKVKRNFDRVAADPGFAAENRSADVLLLSRFQTLVGQSFGREVVAEHRSASFYADQLAVHPNHLNAVAKRITGKTVSQVIQEQLLVAAKNLLRQTSLSIKEVAHQLGFEEPTHFNAFFKKMSGETPRTFRESSRL